MSDHFSGPRAVADPVADIADLYAFPSPERPDSLVLVMNVFPLATTSALFSDAFSYRFRVRPARIVATGRDAAFVIDEAEYTVTCSFSAPQAGDDSTQLVQLGTCITSTGASVTVEVHDDQGASGNGLRVYAGLRRDPFFLDFPRLAKTIQSRQVAFEPHGRNVLDGQNVLSIVVEVELGAVLGVGAGPLFAVVSETVTAGSASMRFERQGRPEVKNVMMGDRTADTVNRDLEIRDLYNEEDPFALRPVYTGAYRARLNANLALWDGFDGNTDWPLNEQGNHPLTELLLGDYLVVDVSKPYAENSYFEIEQAMQRGTVHGTCGGRSLNDDVMDTIYTLIINAGNGSRISDGVDQASVPASHTFPYLAPPNPTPPALNLKLPAQY